jgi:hypothetical protein
MNLVPAKHVDRMTISLPKPLAAAIRAYAVSAHGGKFSPAIAELADRGLAGVTKSPVGVAPEA